MFFKLHVCSLSLHLGIGEPASFHSGSGSCSAITPQTFALWATESDLNSFQPARDDEAWSRYTSGPPAKSKHPCSDCHCPYFSNKVPCITVEPQFFLVAPSSQLPRFSLSRLNMRSSNILIAYIGVVSAQCPYMTGELPTRDALTDHERRQVPSSQQQPVGTGEFMDQFTINDTDVYLTSDVGGPIPDQNSLQSGPRGPTLLEDFIFRQKITHFDHERVCCSRFFEYAAMLTIS